jgi:hydroxymethylglutaryl-CoA reductase
MSAEQESFRKLRLPQRQELIRSSFKPEREEWDSVSSNPRLNELSDIMVEAAIGCLPVPLGLASGFLIDGEQLTIPMAVEEPSVIAAASFAARILRRGGGLSTWAEEPLMSAQIFVEGAGQAAERALRREEVRLGELVDRCQPAMKARGGGFRELELNRLPASGILVVELRIDVRDAMGANVLNTAAEALKADVERLSGGRALMCIVSNAARQRRVGARFSLPVDKLSPLGAEGLGAPEVARRIALASRVAQEDEQRAVTHNKGIMNGISSLALATMNDTRSVEAAAHAWACRQGRYQGLSVYTIRDTERGPMLEGAIELPLALGSVGGAVSFHPASRLALRILGFPDGRRLARIAAAVGLTQNFAALLALVTGGIQRGHMRYHAARLAYKAGARGEEVRRVAELLARRRRYDREEVEAALAGLRKGRKR